MLDVREILKSLCAEDKLIWEQCRVEMRRAYLNAHNGIVGIAGWDKHDDAFMDLIDIKIAILFDRAGKIEFTAKPPVNHNDGEKIEKEIVDTMRTASQKYLDAVAKATDDKITGWPSGGTGK